MSDVPGQLSLATIGGGAALEKFQDELQKVVENILDPNTEAKTKRSIVIKVDIVPTPERNMGAILVSSTAKLAPTRSYGTRAFFGKDGTGNALAFEDDPKQLTINDFIQSTEAKVTQMAPPARGVQDVLDIHNQRADEAGEMEI